MKKKWIKTGIVFLGAGCWFLALLFYGETEKKAGCFNAYYDTPVLTRSALSAFTEQAEQKEPGEQADVLPQTTGLSLIHIFFCKCRFLKKFPDFQERDFRGFLRD